MKNRFNISLSNNSATCGLCQDTLLRHIRQSKVYWYCPSCRQEMVCEEPPKQSTPPVTPHFGQASQHRPLTQVTDRSQRVCIRAS